MKRLCITYQADDGPYGVDTAESRITIPMTDERADDILDRQAESYYVRSYTSSDLTDILTGLARLQGYANATFISAESE